MRWLAIAVAPFALSCSDGVLVCPGVAGGSDWICPGGGTTACALPPTRCGPPEQVEACQIGSGGFKADYDVCSVGGSGGFCASGVCQPCTPDLDGCSYTTWQAMTAPMGVTADLHGIYVGSAHDAYAVGDKGTLLHYDGIRWSQLPSAPGPVDLTSVTGNSAGGIYAVNKSNIVFEADADGNWSQAYAGSSDLQAITSAGTLVTAVGSKAIAQFDGTSWSESGAGSATASDVWAAVWGIGTTRFAVGAGGGVLVDQGSGWTENVVPMAGQISLTAVWGAAPDDVYAGTAVGSETAAVEHYDGVSWTTVITPASGPLVAVWGNGSNAVFAAGQHELLECDTSPCTAWAEDSGSDTPSPPPTLYGLGGQPGGYVFAVGAGATIWKFGQPQQP